MDLTANSEIHFHQQRQASVFLESSEVGQGEVHGEIAVLSGLAIRVLSNLGKCEHSDMIARLFTELPMLRDQLIRPGLAPAEVEIVTYPGVPGRKRFVSSVRINGSSLKTSVHSSGFGLLHVGYGAYAPVAITTLLTMLLRKRSDDLYFNAGIDVACSTIAHNYYSGNISTFSNHHQLVADIVFPLLSSRTEF